MSNKEKKPICASALPNPTPEAKSIPKNDDKPFDFFSGAMKEYWETGHFSDLVISVKGYNVRAHRMVVCSQSGYLNFLVHCLHVKDKKAKTIKNPDNMITTSVNAFKAMIGWVYGIDYIPPGDENKTYIHAEIVKQSTDIPDSEFDAEAFLRLVNHELYCARGGMRFLLTDICVRKIEVLLTEPKLDNVFKNHGHFFPRHSTMGLGRKRPDVRCLECGEFCDNEIVVRVGFVLVRRTGDHIFGDHYIMMNPSRTLIVSSDFPSPNTPRPIYRFPSKVQLSTKVEMNKPYFEVYFHIWTETFSYVGTKNLRSRA
ncbi:hypothetical protein DPV78_009042 [Talaromyces pinophilus]|nr:hypothetical protein DPV78_009042 [Talaromyces pinophilus]